MPVPVPRHNKPRPHPVVKPTSRPLVHPIHTAGYLPVPPRGPPSSAGSLGDEWAASLASWGRINNRPSFEQPAQAASLQQPRQGFTQGLASADIASAIKGPHAEACIPPMHDALRLLVGALAAREREEEMNTPQFDSGDAPYGAAYGENRSPMDVYPYDMGAFSPLYEDHSPSSDSGPDDGSSPLEPLTPFGDYVDREISAAQPYFETQYDERGIPAADYYQGKTIQEVTHAAPVFPSIADVPKQQDPAPPASSSAPSATTGYKKLSEPLAEWIANYVWRVCTTGFDLPPAFTQVGLNSRTYSAAPPNFLTPGVQNLLLATLLQPSAVFLAMWYIARLPVYFGAAPMGAEFSKEAAFRVALFGEDQSGYEREALENSAPIRLVVLGFMLANKWLDDHTFSNKTWFVIDQTCCTLRHLLIPIDSDRHSISSIPGPTLNRLESLALDIFSYDLSISNQQWSQWLGHVMSYHISLTAPGRPQPISRPSANPHMMVRRVIDEIMQSRCPIVAADGLPQPVFLGLEDRIRERAEKEAAMSVDVLEIDLDEDGPLREEYLPKRRASKQLPHATNKPQFMALPELATIKVLPPPAKWSPSGDEPILRERNRSTGHYVAVRAPHLAPAAPVFHLNGQHPDIGFNQNWAPPPPPFMQVKQMAYGYDMQHLNPQAYNPFGQNPGLAVPHSRSQSLSYDQDNLAPRNHMRSYSQAGFGYRFNDLRMCMGEQPMPIPEMEARWMDHNYPYSGPGFVGLPAINLQPAW
ncbi:hypothetical protein CPB83DRAFT_755408 [Crepidotus variabilis]|uniref:Uncharacterized protein n=1 Tax=Crepidotus variabilis TaxID=179855 RepID=A0A9P6EUH8_9AGAR|nr:hypothetical protein CPB83DRAFT_755408 [Crepidotus variabilis]